MAISGPGGGRDDEAEAFVDINITPLTDVILVLLVIFMVASTAVVETERAKQGDSPAAPATPRSGLSIDLPTTREADTTADAASPVLRLAKDGAVELDGQAVSPGALAGQLAAARARTPPTSGGEVVIAADGTVSHAEVVALIERVRAAGFSRVVIGTAPPPPPSDSR